MDAHSEELIQDISRLVKIPSISNPDSGGKDAPFGKACHDAMDEMLSIGRKYGFHTENYEYYVGSIGEKE